MRRWILFGAVLGLVVATGARRGVRAQRETLRLEKLTEELFVVYGNGGNTAIFVGSDAVVVVDSKLEEDGPEIVKLVRSVTDRPIRYLINTHHHNDHCYGNSGFPLETEIVAHENAKQQMLRADFLYWRGPRERGLPKRTVAERVELLQGDNRVEVLHFGRGHTNNDVIVVFARARAAHLGDLFTPRQIPVVDASGGGSAKEFAATIEKVAARLAARVAARKEIELFIPGHGEIVGREKFLECAQMWRELSAATNKALKEKKPLDDFLKELKLDPYAGWKGGTASFKILAATLYNELAADGRPRKKSPEAEAPENGGASAVWPGPLSATGVRSASRPGRFSAE